MTMRDRFAAIVARWAARVAGAAFFAGAATMAGTAMLAGATTATQAAPAAAKAVAHATGYAVYEPATVDPPVARPAMRS